MRIGLVGKPNVGKSTTFAALTESAVEIANYPFTTIDPNVGVTFLPAEASCPCQTLREKREADGRMGPASSDDVRTGSLCEPRTGTCIGHCRTVPVTLVDVAGLVPGAHDGKGRGNQFLNDLAQCDALIQVVDASGGTDIEGNPLGPGSCDPIDEYTFLVEELAMWIHGILDTGWARGVRRVQAEGDRGLIDFITDQLSGIGGSDSMVMNAITQFKSENTDLGVPWEWKHEVRTSLAHHLRRAVFPLCVAANKADVAEAGAWDELGAKVISDGGILLPTSADSELALRRAAKAGFIDYPPGAQNFSLTERGQSELNDAQRKGLEALSERLERLGGTGLVELTSRIVRERLDRIVTFPVQDEGHWTDGDGHILPDALLVQRGTTAKGLAYAVHSDLGDGFIRAVDGRTGRVIGADHELNDNDVIKIVAKT
ncbi:MAG: YchF-related putative GTPase [Candidatus Thermoplasmatota archaeon]|nr:YchF-related putative GTPase [Candidatus Thermoplasmatota archaeon]